MTVRKAYIEFLVRLCCILTASLLGSAVGAMIGLAMRHIFRC